jgi:hypothetical protein
MYNTYGDYTPPNDPSNVPVENPFNFGTERVHGWRTGKPSAFTPTPDTTSEGADDYLLDSAEVGTTEGGGHLYGVQGMRPPWGMEGLDGAKVRAYGRPPWDVSGYEYRSQDQGGAALRREVQGSDVWTDSNGHLVDGAQTTDFTVKMQGDVPVYYQEPPDSYFHMGPYAYPEVNPPRNNNRASSRNTDAARAEIPVRIPGAKERTYVLSAVSQEEMQPVTYRTSFGQDIRPFADGRIGATIGTIRGIPDWAQYSPLDSPDANRTPPMDASQIDYNAADVPSDYSPEDVVY